MSWSKPKNITEWLRRVFSVRPVMLFIFIFAALVLELRFDWMEKAVGSYLVSTNDMRPQSGAIWEKGQQMTVARKTLEKIIINREAYRREVKKAETLNEIARSLTEDQGAMLSPDKFKRLYLKLPNTIALKIISPFELLDLYNQGEWDRTYLNKAEPGLIVHLLNDENRSLRMLEIPSTLLTHMEQFETELEGSLENYPRFENRIYSSISFFTALSALPESIKQGIIPKPEKLLSMHGRIQRVSISDEVIYGFIEIGFEFVTVTEKKVVLIEGEEWAVWDIINALERGGKTIQTEKKVEEKQPIDILSTGEESTGEDSEKTEGIDSPDPNSMTGEAGEPIEEMEDTDSIIEEDLEDVTPEISIEREEGGA